MCRACRQRLPWRSAAIVFVAAFSVRAGFGALRLVGTDDLTALEFPDEVQYWRMASSLASGNGLQDEFGFRATRMPLYPTLLSAFVGMRHGVAVAKGFHWLIGAVGAVLVACLATSLFDRHVGLMAGLMVACDPFLVFFSSLLLTETVFVVGVVGLWLLVRPAWRSDGDPVSPGRWLATGLTAAFCVYARESSLGLIVVLFLLLLILRRFDWRSLVGTALVGGVIVIALVPWAVRNHRVTGEWCWLTHRAGISLYDGVGPQASGASDLANVQQMPEVRNLSEVDWDRYFLGKAVAALQTDPGRIVRLAGVKLGRTWNPFPNVETYQSRLVRFVSAGWTIPIFAFAVGGVILLSRRKKGEGRRVALFLLVPALYFSVLHCLFVGSVRYRLPAMPMIEVLAAVAVAAVLERICRPRNPGERRTGHGKRTNSPTDRA